MNMMMTTETGKTTKIARAKLLAIRDGAYSIYVFKNLDANTYIMCTKLPNWQTPNVSIGDEGFLNYQDVVAGESYYNPLTQTSHVYNYSNVYFMNFVQESEIINSNIIL